MAAPTQAGGEPDPYREHLARQAENIEQERLQRSLTLMGSAAAGSGQEGFSAHLAENVNRLTLAIAMHFRPSEAAAPASQAAGGEVVLYQWRTRAGWLVPDAWSQWECCTPDVAADYERTPLLHDWHYEVRRLCLTAAPAAAVEPIIKYVPINTKEYREHPNDKEVSSPECEQALDDRGDSEGQGLDPFWKWAFRQGWAARGAGGKAMPAGYFLRDEQTGYLRQVQGYMSDYPGVIALYAAAPAAAVEPRTTPLCRDCADFGPICPSSGQPCDKRAAAAPEGLTEDDRWIAEAKKTLERVSAFLQAFDVPHAVNWRDWIDNAEKHFTALRPATPDANHQEDTP